MNCETARDNLIDLVYGELPQARQTALAEHLAGCDACRAELEDLQAARSALAEARAGEPSGDALVGEFATHRPRRSPFRRRLAMACGLAAGIIAAAVLWVVLQEPITPKALAGPIEIKRVGVSLTILSDPAQGIGLALVRDQRIIRNLPAGRSEVRFTDVPGGIQPDSVRLRSMDDPDGLAILEQNYQYDLASAQAIYKRYIDKPVTLTMKDGQQIAGDLMSVGDGTLILRPPSQGPRNVSTAEIAAITLPALPEGLLTQPTLVWQLQNRAQAVQQLEVAYLTHGLTWRADYVLTLRSAAGQSQAGQDATPEIIDRADLVGYATVTNNSGVSYEEAQLKLMAGDVNIIQDNELSRHKPKLSLLDGQDEYLYFGVGFQEKSFFEYHLYTLGQATTIRDAETKQIELVTGEGLKMRRGYVYDPQQNPSAVRVVSELKNSKENGLGKPLPKGVMRLYAPDPEGVPTYIKDTTIDHTPVDETLRLPWGYAFDIACQDKFADATHNGPEHAEKHEYTLRNHKSTDVAVTVLVHVPATTYRAESSTAWHVREVGLVEIPVVVQAGTEARVTFKYHWNDSTGGGLTSPFDPQTKPVTSKPAQ